MVRPPQLLSRVNRRLDALLEQPVPAPPEALRRGPFRRRAFTSRARSPWLTARLGLALGVAFGICFGTGLLSALIIGAGRTPDNPSKLPLNYGLGLATVLGAIWIVVAGLALRARRRPR
jgi:hypothetical protein